jgi:carboxymethylenebutenolidase
MRSSLLVLTALAAALAGCRGAQGGNTAQGDTMAPADTADGAASAALPAGAESAMARLESSSRHGEWVTIPVQGGDSVRAWVVYPERSEPAPVVLVVHEIFGLTGWVRGVADQLAAEGFVAVAPDLLTGKGVATDSVGDPVRDAATQSIRSLDADEVHRRLRAAAEWAMAQPAGGDRYGIVGFCWGGGVSFAHAARYPDLGASVVYYGTPPDSAGLAAVQAPVLGNYGGDDARVTATVAPTDSVMKALGKTYEPHVYEGAGHGFLRQQDGRDGANLAAAKEAWPATVSWFRRYLSEGR